MSSVTVEYVTGPACGRRKTIVVGPSEIPPFRVEVTIPPIWDSALDEKPAVPETTYLYQRAGHRSTPEGRLWEYRCRGPVRSA